MKTTQPIVFPEIETIIENFNFYEISDERKKIVEPLINYIQTKVQNHESVRLNLICTHNSRRSHLAQIWSQTAAAYYKIKNVNCYSGGTEATALYPMVAQTLKKQGFEIEQLSEGTNPIYSIKFSDNEPAIIGFSKKYDSNFNPKNAFAALMTCSQADGGCPFIAGAELRIPFTFDDPKAFDNTPQQAQKYHERSLQIASEMFYVFSQIKPY